MVASALDGTKEEKLKNAVLEGEIQRSSFAKWTMLGLGEPPLKKQGAI